MCSGANHLWKAWAVIKWPNVRETQVGIQSAAAPLTQLSRCGIGTNSQSSGLRAKRKHQQIGGPLKTVRDWQWTTGNSSVRWFGPISMRSKGALKFDTVANARKMCMSVRLKRISSSTYPISDYPVLTHCHISHTKQGHCVSFTETKVFANDVAFGTSSVYVNIRPCN